MDFSNNVVVGLGMDADDKLAVRDQFKIFTNNLFSLKVCHHPCLHVTHDIV